MSKTDGQLRVRQLFSPQMRTPDFYHQLLRATWPQLTVFRPN
jgi:hypothetical protein